MPPRFEGGSWPDLHQQRLYRILETELYPRAPNSSGIPLDFLFLMRVDHHTMEGRQVCHHQRLDAPGIDLVLGNMSNLNGVPLLCGMTFFHIFYHGSGVRAAIVCTSATCTKFTNASPPSLGDPGRPLLLHTLL